MIKTVLFAVAEKEWPDRDPHGGVGLDSDHVGVGVGLDSDHVDVEEDAVRSEGGATSDFSFSTKTAEQKVTTRTRDKLNPPIKGL